MFAPEGSANVPFVKAKMGAIKPLRLPFHFIFRLPNANKLPGSLISCFRFETHFSFFAPIEFALLI